MRTSMAILSIVAATVGTPLGGVPTSAASPAQSRLVFVSPPPDDAAFIGGLTGADLVCREAAEAYGLRGVFLAFLGDGIVGPVNRFDADLAPVVNVNGEQVAADWRSFAAGHAEAQVLHVDGTSATVTPWTNVGRDGGSGLLATACDRWWNSGRRHAGAVGIEDRDVASCDSRRPFLCLQQ